MTQPVEPLDEAFGEYVLERRLGEGGMAVTFVARERISDIGERLVAIKQILPQFSTDPKFRQMFYDEVRVSSLLNHRNICRTYRAGEIDDKLYMSMEFVDGLSVADLRHRVQAHGERFPLEHALYLVSEVLEGLHAAHTAIDANGVALELVHRDVSPQNVLVSRKGEVKIIDFGVAKAASNLSKTKTGAVKGKLLYLSTEQLQAKPLDGRSDIFSVGLMLYELLTDQHPFEGPDEHATIYNYCTRDIIAPTQVASRLPAAIDAPVMAALQRDRERRFPDAQSAARAFTDVLYTISPQYRAYHFADFVAWALASEPGPMPAMVPTGSSFVGSGAAALEPQQTGASAAARALGAGAIAVSQPPNARHVGGSNGKALALLIGLLVLLVLVAIAGAVLWTQLGDEEEVRADGAAPQPGEPVGEAGAGDEAASATPPVPGTEMAETSPSGVAGGATAAALSHDDTGPQGDDATLEAPAVDDEGSDDPDRNPHSAWGYGHAVDDYTDDSEGQDGADDGAAPSAWALAPADTAVEDDGALEDDSLELPAWIGTAKDPVRVGGPSLAAADPAAASAEGALVLPPEVEQQLALFLSIAPGLAGTRIETMYRIMMYSQVDVAMYLEHFGRFCRGLRTEPWSDAERELLRKHFAGQDPCIGFNTSYP